MIKVEMILHADTADFENEVNEFLKSIEMRSDKLIDIKYSTISAQEMCDSMFTAMIIYEGK